LRFNPRTVALELLEGGRMLTVVVLATRPSRGIGRSLVVGLELVTIRSSDKHVFEMLGHFAVGNFCQILSDLADDFGANAVGDRCPQIA